MDNPTTKSNTTYSRKIPGLGEICIRPLDLANDCATIHQWVTQPYALYWGMQDNTLAEVETAYKQLLARKKYEVLMGMLGDRPIFLMERYHALEDIIANYYPAEEGDYGMHILVAPPTIKITNFTWQVFSTVMEALFADPAVGRVVVEPDKRNEKIHVLNKKAGFRYVEDIRMPHKVASLALCSQQDYQNALAKLAQQQTTAYDAS